jgi:Tfp pilus assembly protein PilP
MRVLVFACALALSPLAAFAQSASVKPASPKPAPPATSASTDASASAKVSTDKAAAKEEPAQSGALEPAGYTYNPDGRRDPFVSLLRRGAELPATAPGPRPQGLAGLTASEVSLRGTLKGRDGFVAMLQGADNKTYLARPGDRLLDGSIRSISGDSLVIVQRVNDPLSGDTQREVRKVLRSTETGN